jgi:hypothetical protein
MVFIHLRGIPKSLNKEVKDLAIVTNASFFLDEFRLDLSSFEKTRRMIFSGETLFLCFALSICQFQVVDQLHQPLAIIENRLVHIRYQVDIDMECEELVAPSASCHAHDDKFPNILDESTRSGQYYIWHGANSSCGGYRIIMDIVLKLLHT